MSEYLDYPADEADPVPRLWGATDLQPATRPEWLATGRIPRNAVSILIGDEGIGKSLLWVWIAAAVTTGKPLPEFGIPARDPQKVLIVVTEDDWSTTVRPRLEVAAADLEMIDVICEQDDGTGSPVFPRDLHLIARAPDDYALIVLDAFLDTVYAGINMKDPQQARQALHPWSQIATVKRTSVLLLTHTNRVESRNARDKYGITGELRKKARMTLYAQQDDEGHLVVGPEKSNLVGDVPASKFGITSVQYFERAQDSDGTVPILRYLGESDRTARQHIEAAFDANHGHDDSQRTEAEMWLEDYLTVNGKVASKEIRRDAKKDHISERTLQRAAKSLKVTMDSEGFPRMTYWSLPSDATSNPMTLEPGATGATAADLHKRSGVTGATTQSRHPQSHGGTTGATVLCRICNAPLDPAIAHLDAHPGCE